MKAAGASGEGRRGVNPVHGMCPARKGVMRMRSWWPALRAVIRDLNPGYFALVMTTGIVSRPMSLDGASRLSGSCSALGSWPACCWRPHARGGFAG
jgi:hypothetical protein